ITSSSWPFISVVLGQMAHLVTSITLNSARSYEMQSAFLTQGTVSNIPIVFCWSNSIRTEGFLSSVLLWLVIIVAVVGVDVTVSDIRQKDKRHIKKDKTEHGIGKSGKVKSKLTVKVNQKVNPDKVNKRNMFSRTLEQEIKDGLGLELMVAIDKENESSVKDLNLTPSESEDAFDGECDLPVCDDFPKSHLITFSNPLFDIDDDCTSSDDESFFEEDVPMENFNFFSNPLFDLDEEIISTEVNLIQNEVLENITSIPLGIDSFDAKSNLIESLLNQNTLIDYSSKIDSLLDEFAGELTLLKSIPLGIDDDNLDPEGEIHLVERLLYDNSSPRLPEELNVENTIESFSPSPIPVEDSDSLMKDFDLFLISDNLMPPGIENDDYNSEGDILFLEELLSNDSPSLLENESFHFNIPSSPCPPAKPPDDGIYFEPDIGLLTTKVVGDISENYVLMPRLLPTQPTLCPVIDTLLPFSSENKDKVHLLSHRGFKAFQLFSESPMMIYGEDIHVLDVSCLHFYPP
ncbi:hypothetical protein Tco_1154810, partial [Tanacetum coccineum]